MSKRAGIVDDVVAGLLLAGLLVPQGIAYAGIAGVDPQRGLYAAAAGLLAYAIFGTSRHLAVAPTSSAAAILASAVLPLAGADTAAYAALGSALAIAVGVVFVSAGLLKLGAISDFVSRPVLKGFMFGLGLTIAAKQLSKLTGVSEGHGGFFDVTAHFLSVAGQTDALTFALGAGALVALFVFGSLAPRLPAGLLVLGAGIGLSTWFDLSSRGVDVIGFVAGGLPVPKLPGVGFEQGVLLLEAAAGIVLVAFSEALGAGRTYAIKHKYEIEPNRELIALGLANLAAAVMQGIPVGAGASASAVNERAGARTQLSSVTASAMVVLTLLFLMHLFRTLPQAILAAVVIHAVSGLADVAEMRRYARITRGLIPALTALGGVLVFGVLRGMLIAMIVNIVLLIRRLATTGCVSLGRLPDSETYVDVDQYPEARPIPGVLLVQLDGMLFFGNVDHVLGRLRTMAAEASPAARALILNVGTVFDVDLAGLDMLGRLHSDLAAEGIELTLVRVNNRVRDLLDRAGVTEQLGAQRIFYSQKDAVRAVEARLAYAGDNPA